MADVVNFPAKQDRIWVCRCGCSTFNLLDGGRAECAACGSWDVHEGAGWSYDLGGRHDEFDGQTFNDIHGNGSVEFARARMRRDALRDDVRMIVLGREDGSIACWFDVTTEEQREWALEKMADAKAMLEGYDLG